jgi:hypothetical protein
VFCKSCTKRLPMCLLKPAARKPSHRPTEYSRASVVAAVTCRTASPHRGPAVAHQRRSRPLAVWSCAPVPFATIVTDARLYWPGQAAACWLPVPHQAAGALIVLSPPCCRCPTVVFRLCAICYPFNSASSFPAGENGPSGCVWSAYLMGKEPLLPIRATS